MKLYLALVVSLLLACVCFFAFGDAAPAPDTFQWLSDFIAKIPNEGIVLTVTAVLLEAGLRLWKTDKPRSILFAVARLFVLLSELFAKLAVLLNKVIPQRTKAVDLKIQPLEGPK